MQRARQARADIRQTRWVALAFALAALLLGLVLGALPLLIGWTAG